MKDSVRLFTFRFKGKFRIWANWARTGLWWDDIRVGKKYDYVSINRIETPQQEVIWNVIIWRLAVSIMKIL